MKINCEFDTVTKQLVVTVDGQVVDNIDNVSFYKSCCYDDEVVKHTARVSKSTIDKVNKVEKNEIVYASQNEPQAKVKIPLKHLKA